MSATLAERPWRPGAVSPWLLAWGLLVVATALVWFGAEHWSWAVKAPRGLRWDVDGLGGCKSVRSCVSISMKWLISDEATVFPFSFKDFTRTIAAVIEVPYQGVRGLLSTGFKLPLGAAEGGTGPVVWVTPTLSWLALVAVATWFAYRIKDWRLALLVFSCLAYLVAFGQWDSALVTFSSIVVAVPIGVVLGLLLGIYGHRHPRFKLAITPLLDLMQTVPIFAYLVPVLLLFGFGPVSAIVATIIYAMPPMVRIAMLSLKTVPDEIVEYGRMAGCTQRQLTWRVLVPAAMPSLMVGVNQVIMLSLNMVIIASMIGAGGLGFDVLASLRRQAIGEGLEAGLAITLIAITLDRLSQAYARRSPPSHEEIPASWLRRNRHLAGALALLVLFTLLGGLSDLFRTYPPGLEISTGSFWNDLVKWININFFDQLEAVKIFFLLGIMKPLKLFLLALPWPCVLLGLGLAGWQLGGWRLALLCVLLAGFVVLTGQWSKAMITVYLCGTAVVLATMIGLPIGIWAARNETANRVITVAIDTLQTLPSFVYLLPVVMLFRVGDFSAMVAVVLYALPPAIRYANHGIRQVSPAVIEAAKTSGCTRWQTLVKVQFPLALPTILLGLNQTIMFALSMLVITALVGTRDLGQEVYIALTKADVGRGFVAGLSVAFIAIIADRLIAAAVRRRKAALGLQDRGQE